ncbi:MAG: hypothetical protein KH230_25215 [Enterocloster asparagiformis]|nr:hypothetical protein [Enterocloster asparagiformis]
MRKSADLANVEANERRIGQKIKVADLVAVTAYNAGKSTVDVKPLVKRELAGAYVSPPPVLGVKVAYIPLEIEVDGKKASVKPDINPGDIGVVVYLDFDSDAAAKTGSESQPGSSRLHSGDDAVFVGVIAPG